MICLICKQFLFQLITISKNCSSSFATSSLHEEVDKKRSIAEECKNYQTLDFINALRDTASPQLKCAGYDLKIIHIGCHFGMPFPPHLTIYSSVKWFDLKC